MFSFVSFYQMAFQEFSHFTEIVKCVGIKLSLKSSHWLFNTWMTCVSACLLLIWTPFFCFLNKSCLKFINLIYLFKEPAFDFIDFIYCMIFNQFSAILFFSNFFEFFFFFFMNFLAFVWLFGIDLSLLITHAFNDIHFLLTIILIIFQIFYC